MTRFRLNAVTRPRAAGALAALLGVALVASPLAVPAQAQGALGDPVLALEFDNSLADGSDLAHPVTAKATGTAAPAYAFVPGVRDSALKLTAGTYLDLGRGVELQPRVMTASFWLKPDTAMVGEQVIAWNKAAYNSDGWYLSSEGNGSPLALSAGPGGAQPYKIQVSSADRAAFFPVGQWTHIAVSYHSDTKRAVFYRNGLRVPSQVAQPVGGASTGVITADANLPKTLGFNGPQYNGSFLTSALDSYRLYAGEATAADVVGLYEEGGGTVDKDAVARADAAAITLPATVAAALALPREGSSGSTVTWASSDRDVIDLDGTVHQPGAGEDDAHVTLTATVRFADGAPAVREFAVTVPAVREVLQDSGLSVRLDDAYLDNAAAKEHEYLLSLDSRQFLHWFYRTANLTPPTATGYQGWENGAVSGNFRGHAFGHYMSALAMSYASTSDPAVKEGLHREITEAVDGLAEVQAAYAGTSRAGYLGPFRDTALDAVEGRGASDDPVVVPYYNLHKVLAGLLDINKYVPDAHGGKALEIAKGFGGYLYGRVSTLADTSVMLRTEYGGMNDALYELYARSGGDARFKRAAEAFDELSLFRELAANRDVLNGKHANTTIPKLIGAVKRYTVFTQNPALYDKLTAQEKADLPMYLQAAQNFWQIVVDHHTYATGANSQAEHFHGPDTLHEFATGKGVVGNAETAETCNEYNMLKLSRELFKLTQDVKYANYYENTFINTILSSQNPDTGMTTYFQAMAPGYYKLYSMPFTEFWCCTGTGMENFSKLGDSIYFTGSDGVWVNMFFSSVFEHGNLRVRQEANLPNDDTVTFRVEAVDGGAVPANAKLRLRVPDWAAAAPGLTVNGSAVTPQVQRGYVVLGVRAGDVVEYRLPMAVRLVETPDNPDFFALKYGPVLLSAGLGTKDLDKFARVGILVRAASLDPDAPQVIQVDTPTVAAWKADLANNVVRGPDTADGQVRFTLRNAATDLEFTPHYRRHDERYGLYFSYETADSEAAQQRILDDKRRLRDTELTIDSLYSFDNNNFEGAKNLKQANSSVGVFSGQQFRHAEGPSGWFSYDLRVDPAQASNLLRVRYYSGDAGRTFDVYLNDEKFKTETVNRNAGTNVFYLQTDEIPRKHLDNPRWKVDQAGNPVLDENGQRIPVVTVRFQSTGGWAGGVFGVATSKSLVYGPESELSGLKAAPGVLTPAFTPGATAYALRVPAGTTEVDVDFDPHVPSGLVKVDGVLIDDTRPRKITLDASGRRTVTVDAFAQDHVTSTRYTLEISAATPALAVTAVPRCVGGTAHLAVTAVNTGTSPVAVTVATPFGGAHFAAVEPGKQAYQSFNTRTGDLAAGVVTATVVEGGVSTSHRVDYPALRCP
ncbi:beta-L-arabinofuranosidase domain-containing protein [Actinosynnema sp. NPDC059335]|uniref:beta-L-arabinofuranosidase domain-containing protein n=1 Tax=Actinosynnema sp. NPDC059335 TaxID=3346804 RepID=UPI00366A649A